jgi:hypothetical protein
MTEQEKILIAVKKALAAPKPIGIRWKQNYEVIPLDSFEGRAFGLFFYAAAGESGVCVMDRCCKEAHGKDVREALTNYLAMFEKGINDEPGESFGGLRRHDGGEE